MASSFFNALLISDRFQESHHSPSFEFRRRWQFYDLEKVKPTTHGKPTARRAPFLPEAVILQALRSKGINAAFLVMALKPRRRTSGRC